MIKTRLQIMTKRIESTIERIKLSPEVVSLSDIHDLINEISEIEEKEFHESIKNLPDKKGVVFYMYKAQLLELAVEMIACELGKQCLKIKHVKEFIK